MSLTPSVAQGEIRSQNAQSHVASTAPGSPWPYGPMALWPYGLGSLFTSLFVLQRLGQVFSFVFLPCLKGFIFKPSANKLVRPDDDACVVPNH